MAREARARVISNDLPAKPPKEFSAIDPVTLPNEYALEVLGNCMASEIDDGDMVVETKNLRPKPGNLVLIVFKPGSVPPGVPVVSLKRLVLYCTGGDIAPCLHVEAADRKIGGVRLEAVAAVHKCLGLWRGAGPPPAAASDKFPSKPRKQRGRR